MLRLARQRSIPHGLTVAAGCGLAGLALAITGAANTRVPTPTTVVEYPLPRPNAFPHDPAVGLDGTVWYTDQANSYIGRLDPATGKVTDFATPTPKSGPHGIIVAPTGGVWYTANAAGRIGRVDPANGHIREFTLPAAARDPHTPLLVGAKLWFTVQQADLYGVLDTVSGASHHLSCAGAGRIAVRDRQCAKSHDLDRVVRHQCARPCRSGDRHAA